MIDAALSPRLAQELVSAGFDAVHVCELGLAAATDAVILARAVQERRTVVSRDGDFSALLAHANADRPSFVHLRTPGVNRPADQVVLLRRVLSLAGADLAAGAIVTVRGDRIRIRRLPMRTR